jgi:Zn-dependent protease
VIAKKRGAARDQQDDARERPPELARNGEQVQQHDTHPLARQTHVPSDRRQSTIFRQGGASLALVDAVQGLRYTVRVDAEGFLSAGLALIPLLLSVAIHEYAHGWTAYRLGDTTAKDAGRLTLNPIAHLDLFGSVILPLLLYLSGAPIFGWARPVPVDASRCTRVSPRMATVLTAGAGPLSNTVLAALSAGLLALVGAMGGGPDWLMLFLRSMLALNLLLALFNLLPIPPLDGSRAVFAALPPSAVSARLAYARAGPLLLVVACLVGGRLIYPPYNYLLDRISEAIGVGATP